MQPGRIIYQATMSPRLFQRRLRHGSVRINEDGEIEKLCPVCKEWWPADSDFFVVQNRKADGLDWRCRACKFEATPSRANKR